MKTKELVDLLLDPRELLARRHGGVFVHTVAIDNTGVMRYLNPLTKLIMKPIFNAWLRKYKKILEARPMAAAYRGSELSERARPGGRLIP